VGRGEQQAAERRQQDKRSTAEGREGEPLRTNVEELYQIKLANLERETITTPGRTVHQAGSALPT